MIKNLLNVLLSYTCKSLNPPKKKEKRKEKKKAVLVYQLSQRGGILHARMGFHGRKMLHDG
jgi:hypothetical protein